MTDARGFADLDAIVRRAMRAWSPAYVAPAPEDPVARLIRRAMRAWSPTATTGGAP